MGVPDECDLCRFRELMKRGLIVDNTKDEFTLLCIMRDNLDVVWS